VSRELVAAFSAVWNGSDAPAELGTLLAQICADARQAHPELTFDDRALVAAIAARCPTDHVVTYVQRCRAAELVLARCAGDGDATAIAALERAHHATIESIARRFVSAGHTVDDLRQLLRVKLFTGASPGIHEFAGQGHLDSWLRVTATRLFLDLTKRKDRPREVQGSDSGIAALCDPSDLGLELIKVDYRAAVRAAIEQAARELDPGDRHLLRQHFVTGLTVDQLAAALGIHRATAARRIVKAREKLAATARSELQSKLAIPAHELGEMFGLVVSRLDLSISRVLASQS
jgi:RNA polymerase sigma-70 factor, ECF subfamily